MDRKVKFLVWLGIITLIIVVIIGVKVFSDKTIDTIFGGGGISYATATSSVYTTAAGQATIVLKANPGRGIAVLQNLTATVAYLAFHATSSPNTIPLLEDRYFVIPLAASGGTYQIDEDNPYVGQVIASSSAAVTIRALEAY